MTVEKFSIDVNQLNVIKFQEQIDQNDLILRNTESCFRLFYLIYSIIGRQDLVSFSKNSIQMESFKSHEMKNYDESVQTRYRLPIHCLETKKNLKEKSKQIGCIFYFKQRNEVLITIGDRLLIYDPNTFNFLRQLSLRTISESDVRDIFYREDKNKLCLLGDITIYCLNVDHDEYQIESLYDFHDCNSGYFNSACLKIAAFNNNKIYLNNMKTNDIIEMDETRMINKIRVKEPNVTTKSMKFINDFLFVLKVDCVLVYDSSSLNYVTSFGNSIIFKAQSFFIDEKTPNYLYILDTSDKSLKVFNLSFKYIGRIKIESALEWSEDRVSGDIINGHLILFDNSSMFVQEIVYSSFNDQNSLNYDHNGFYICKLNRSNHHMCRNPYLLPCGNIACLECIYDNYNLFLNKFQCNFDECGAEHELNGKLEKLNITNDNVKSICLYQTDYAASCPPFSDYLGKYHPEKKKS